MISSERDQGLRPRPTTDQLKRLKELERENRELRLANEMLRTASAFFRAGGARLRSDVMVSFIDAHRDEYGVEPIVRELPIALSAYYEHLAGVRDPTRHSARAKRDAVLCPRIKQIWEDDYRVYGARKLWRQMKREADDVTVEDYEKHLLYASSRLNKVPIAFISAKTGENVLKSLSMVKVLDANLDMQVSTPYLNRIFEKNDPGLVPIPRSSKRPNFLYIVQSGKRPVEFKYFVNDPGLVLPAHHNFIENQLRYNLPLKGIPIKVHFSRSRKK